MRLWHYNASINSHFYPFKPNGISNSYQLDQSISVLRILGGIFHFYSNFNLSLCKQTVETLIRRRVLQIYSFSRSILSIFVTEMIS